MKRLIFNELSKWRKSEGRLPLILEGARQVGKTYILKKFGETEFIKTHYFNFEEDKSLSTIFEKDLIVTRILDDLSFVVNSSINPETDLIIFDEIQEAPLALKSLKYFAENMPELAICSAGSLLGVYLSHESFPVGKVSFLKLHPFSFAEFLLGTNEDKLYKFVEEYQFNEISTTVHKLLWEKFLHYLIVGGLPRVILSYKKHLHNGLFAAFQEVEKIQGDLVKGYTADIAKHSGKINSIHIEKVWISAAKQLGESFDSNAKKYRFKDVINKSKIGYREQEGPIGWLEKAGLVIRNSISSKAQLPLAAYIKENQFKLFIFDIGILRSLLEVSPKTILDYSFGTYKGFYVENYISQELISLMHTNFNYSWAEGKAEIEFLIQINGEIIPIEVKSGKNRRSKSLTEYNKKYAPRKRVIMSGDNHISSDALIRLPLYLSSFIKNL